MEDAMSAHFQPPNMTISPVEFPATYEQICIGFLHAYWEDRAFEMHNSFGFTGLMPPDDVRQFLAAESLSVIARAAAGELNREGDDSDLPDHIQTLMERLFAAPGLPGVFEIPDAFWDEPLGQMVARALIWSDGDELITITEAARIAGVTDQAIANRIRAGKLRAYYDPDARNPQKGRRLVRRSDVAPAA